MTFYELMHALARMVPGLTGTARTELAATIDRHQIEHEALARQLPEPAAVPVPVPPAAPAVPPETPPAAPATEGVPQ